MRLGMRIGVGFCGFLAMLGRVKRVPLCGVRVM